MRERTARTMERIDIYIGIPTVGVRVEVGVRETVPVPIRMYE